MRAAANEDTINMSGGGGQLQHGLEAANTLGAGSAVEVKTLRFPREVYVEAALAGAEADGPRVVRGGRLESVRSGFGAIADWPGQLHEPSGRVGLTGK